jgi:PAS domain S-box-containing protein
MARTFLPVLGRIPAGCVEMNGRGKIVRTPVGAYVVAVAAGLAAVLLRWLLDPVMGDTLPLVTLFGAVAAAVWVGGYRPALLVVVLGYLACAYLFVEPRGSFGFGHTRNLIGLLAYVVTCSIIVGFGEAMRVSQRRFEEVVRQQEKLSPPMSETVEAIRRKHGLNDIVVIGFGLVLAVLVTGAVFGYLNAERVVDNQAMVAHTHVVIGELDNLLSTLKDAESGQRGYLLRRNPEYLQPYTDALGRVGGELEKLDELTSDNREQQARLRALEQTVAELLGSLRKPVAQLQAGDRTGALNTIGSNISKARMDDVRAEVAVMREEEEKLLKQRVEESKASSTVTKLSIVLTAVIGAALIGCVFYLGQRNLMQRQRAAEILAVQRERLRVTLASIGDAVITTDAEGRVAYLNGVAESLTGWTQAEAAGKPLDAVFRIVNEQTRTAVDNPAKRALGEGTVVGLANHTVLVRKDGTERPIDDSASPIRDGRGHVVGCVLVFRDITARRRLERENADRLAAARFLASIIESSDDAIVSKSLEGVIQSWNVAAERLFGYTAEQAVGRHISLILPADRADEENQLVTRIRAGERVDHFETVRVRSDGQPVHVSLTASPIKDEAGHVVGVSKIARDITDRKQAEERIYGLMNELKEGDRRKDEFLAMLAHEMRGPLAPLRNMLEIMNRAEGDGDLLQKARSTMERQLSQLVRLVDDLVDVNRITRGKIELRKECVELASVIHQSVESCRTLAGSANLELSVTLPPHPVYLNADPVRLVQVFSNIVHNACKYTESGGKIWLTAERQGSDAVVMVKDTGIGIPPEKLVSVFEMFTQVDRTLRRMQGGLGIGLTLVKRLVEMHGGSVEALSEGPGRGSEFVVRLPVLVEKPEGAIREPSTEPTEITAQRILVVDDNADAASSLAMLLELTGNETHAAHDGLEAVEAAEKFRPDVILLDIGLPRLNGLDACRRIREQPWGKNVLLVALTGWGQDIDRSKSKEAGFDAHMVKPVDYAALVKLLAEKQATRV